MTLRKKVAAPPAPASSTERYMVPVVRSTFRILEELSRGGLLGLNQITQRTGLSKSTIFRILATLTALGYVVRDDERGGYYIGHAVGALVSAEASVDALRRAAMPQMLALRDRFGETVNLGALQFDKVIYLEVVPSEYALRLHERAGATVPLHASALGKAILAFSEEGLATSLLSGRELPRLTRNTLTDPEQLRTEIRRVRDRGYAFDRGEISLLASCVAAPIIDASGKAVAALSISGPTSRFQPKKDSLVVESLLKAVVEIGKQLKSSVALR